MVKCKPNRVSDPWHDKSDCVGGSEGNEIHTIGEDILHLRRSLNRQAGLADAARADQTEQAAVRVAQELTELLHVALAAAQWSWQDGQIGSERRRGRRNARAGNWLRQRSEAIHARCA